MNDDVYIDMAFSDETWGLSPPMPRWVAEMACLDFALGVPYTNGKTVIVALIVPWMKES